MLVHKATHPPTNKLGPHGRDITDLTSDKYSTNAVITYQLLSPTTVCDIYHTVFHLHISFLSGILLTTKTISLLYMIMLKHNIHSSFHIFCKHLQVNMHVW